MSKIWVTLIVTFIIFEIARGEENVSTLIGISTQNISTTPVSAPNSTPATIVSTSPSTPSTEAGDAPTSPNTNPNTNPTSGATTPSGKTQSPATRTTTSNFTTATVKQSATSGFDVGSFFGGFVLCAAIVAIIYFGCKVFRGKKPDYNTL